MPESNKFLKSQRLLNKNDFQGMRNGSRFLVSGILLFYYKENNLEHSRLGVAVTKKFGKANKRNKMKRKIREFFRNSDLVDTTKDILVAVNTKKISKENLDFNSIYNLVDSSFTKAISKGLF